MSASAPRPLAAPLRLLLVEDSPGDAELILDLLELVEGIDVQLRWVRTIAEARVALTDRPDCVLLDLGLPDAHGLEGLHALRQAAPAVPIVVLTGRDDTEFAVRAVAAGAQDYVLKGTVDGDATIRMARYAMERQRVHGLLERRALEDALTGLGNRALLVDRLTLALSRRRRAERPVALLFVDLDGFKLVNDRHGHAAGDRLLREVAEALRCALRTEDTAARFGGDEFAALCEDIPDEHAAGVVAARVVQSVRDLATVERPISVSVGVAVSELAISPEQLLARADAAMYAAKHEGKDRWAIYANAREAQVAG